MKRSQLNSVTDFEKIIAQRYSSLSKGQKKIADYIKLNHDAFPFMTAAKVAEAVGVSESTVVRFAKTLGYKGYVELTRTFQDNLKKRLTTAERFERSLPIIDKDNIVKAVMLGDVQNIKNTIHDFDDAIFKRVVKKIKNARKIYIIGNRSSTMLAEYLYFYLNFIFDNLCLMSHGPNDIYDELINANEKDVLIAFSYPRYANATLAAVNFAYQKKAKIIGFTDNLNSPISEYSNLLLTTKHDMPTFIDSLVAPISLINALIIALTADDRERLKRKFDELEETWTKNAVYKRS